MENIVLTHLTVPEVRQLFRQELANFFANQPQLQSLNADTETIDRCTFREALQFLTDNGYPVSESALYKLTSSKSIPFKHFGRKLIFSRKDLLAWVETQTVEAKSPSEGATMALSKSARRK